MKKILATATLLAAFLSLQAQNYDMTFRLEGVADSLLYIARHHRDQLQPMDSAQRAKDGSYRFRGKRNWPRGIYALVHQDGKKAIGDFTIDGSQRFTLTADDKLTPSTVHVKGCQANSRMFGYLAVVADAQQKQKQLRELQKDPSQRPQAEAEEAALIEQMKQTEKGTLYGYSPTLFFRMVAASREGDVPDSVEDKAFHYRAHYWDNLFGSEFGVRGPEAGDLHSALLYSPNLYNKVNYFFFGQLYRAHSDTICREIDRLAARIGDDTALLRYVFDHIEPRYFRSTRNIGWDAVWCHLASEYYLKGRCPWATEGTLHNMRYNYNRIRQSLIGAHGQELWMADTNQSADTKDWISSHRFPTRYVILWFWDPDCHHCQEQSAELAALCDSLRAANNPRFTVYAVGYESDVDKWKKYLREHHMPFVNVGGPNVNVDYQEAYNVHGAPTMIILNERRDIIMNKTLPVKSILPFLDNYEKQQP